MGGMSELRSTGLNSFLVLATTCLHWGVHLTANVKMILCSTALGHWICVWGGVCLSWICLTANVKLTLCSTALGHWIHLWGVPSDLSAKRTSENMNPLRVWVLLHRGLVYKRPINTQKGKWQIILRPSCL